MGEGIIRRAHLAPGSHSRARRVRGLAAVRPFGFAVAAGVALALVWAPLYALACAVSGVQAYQATSTEVGTAMDIAAAGKLGAAYPTMPPLEKGYPAAERLAAPVPCVVLKAIGYVEGSWRQAAGSVPAGSTGPVKQSQSCGYGIMQITSGMRQPGELPEETQLRIASDYRFNIGWAAKVLADKWNGGDFLDAVVGNRDPAVAEDWYYATWAYNQFTFRNNPNNPDFPWPRPAFNGTLSRTNYPYQELVWGFAANPPREGGRLLWDPVPLTLPPREQVGETPGPVPQPSPSHPAGCRLLYTEPSVLELSLPVDSAPVTRAVTLAALGGPATVPWQLAPATASWLRVGPASGPVLPAHLSVQVDPRGLRPGVHNATVGLNAPTGGYPAGQLVVSLRVEPPARFFFPWVPRRVVGR